MLYWVFFSLSVICKNKVYRELLLFCSLTLKRQSRLSSAVWSLHWDFDRKQATVIGLLLFFLSIEDSVSDLYLEEQWAWSVRSGWGPHCGGGLPAPVWHLGLHLPAGLSPLLHRYRPETKLIQVVQPLRDGVCMGERQRGREEEKKLVCVIKRERKES